MTKHGPGRGPGYGFIGAGADGYPPPTAPTPVDRGRVLTEVEAAAARAGGSITVVVLDADGRSLVAGPDPGAPTYTASMAKILVLAGLLTLDATGSLSLTGEDRALMQRAVVSSDDDAMNPCGSGTRASAGE